MQAACWRPGTEVPEIEAALADPVLARYVEGFGREGDVGVVAGGPGSGAAGPGCGGRGARGAAWARRLTAEAPGYGFVDEATPELALAVVPGHRGGGLGTALLEALLVEARAQGVVALSLSVDRDNPARRLYRRLGFVEVAERPAALTMLRQL